MNFIFKFIFPYIQLIYLQSIYLLIRNYYPNLLYHFHQCVLLNLPLNLILHRLLNLHRNHLLKLLLVNLLLNPPHKNYHLIFIHSYFIIYYLKLRHSHFHKNLMIAILKAPQMEVLLDFHHSHNNCYIHHT